MTFSAPNLRLQAQGLGEVSFSVSVILFYLGPASLTLGEVSFSVSVILLYLGPASLTLGDYRLSCLLYDFTLVRLSLTLNVLYYDYYWKRNV